MFKDPVLNEKLKEALKKRWFQKHPGVLSTYGSRKYGRKSYAYKVWRKAVLKRDGYKCVKCGSTKRVHVHHKDQWFKNRSLNSRFSIHNGITLCFECHKKIHPWLGGVNGKDGSRVF